MKRTQIYIEETQDERLALRAQEVGRTKSELIRDAIDVYFGVEEGRVNRLARFRKTLGSTFGVLSDLPSGVEFVENIRQHDSARLQRLNNRGEK